MPHVTYQTSRLIETSRLVYFSDFLNQYLQFELKNSVIHMKIKKRINPTKNHFID